MTLTRRQAQPSDGGAHVVTRVEERFGGFWTFCACGAHSKECVDRSAAARWTCPIGEALREVAIAAAHLRRCEHEAQAADSGAAEMRVANAAMFVVRGFRIR
jgi:hypothetical protein